MRFFRAFSRVYRRIGRLAGIFVQPSGEGEGVSEKSQARVGSDVVFKVTLFVKRRVGKTKGW